MLHTKKEIRDHLRTITRLTTGENSMIDNMINLTLNEINDYTLWIFNRRKTTFDTIASTEDYVLPRDLDYIGVIRQTTSPVKLLHLPDEIFYKVVPNPTATGNPKWYRLWEEEGVSTRLAEADTIDLASSSVSDDSTFSVTIVGYDSNGIRTSEVYTLDGTTEVTGSTTWAAGRPLRISKSGTTTGDITLHEHSGSTTVVILGKEERSPRFKIIGLYPIPSSDITMYLEYFTRLRELVNNADVPDFPQQWHWLLREGALAKIYQFQNKLNDYSAAESRYQVGLGKMKAKNELNVDYIPVMNPRGFRGSFWDNYLWSATVTEV